SIDPLPAVSSARFANVAFSNGSLLHSWIKRFERKQPLSAPNDIRRFFVTSEESARLCLFSLLKGEHGEVFFPRLNFNDHLRSFPYLAERFLSQRGFRPAVCDSEEEARAKIDLFIRNRSWPCYFFRS